MVNKITGSQTQIKYFNIFIGVTFGGPKMDVLFVTTSRSIYFNYFDATLSSDVPSNNTMAGKIFMVTGLKTKGCPAKRLKSFS